MNPFQLTAQQDRAAFVELRRAFQKQQRQRPVEMIEMENPFESSPVSNPPIRAWVSRDFLAALYDDRGTMRLSINRAELTNDGNWKANITWDELQSIKAQCGYGNLWAVEVFPPDRNVVNVANMRHLWILPNKPFYGWAGGEP